MKFKISNDPYNKAFDELECGAVFILPGYIGPFIRVRTISSSYDKMEYNAVSLATGTPFEFMPGKKVRELDATLIAKPIEKVGESDAEIH